MFFKKFGTIPYSLEGYSKEAMNIIAASVVKHFNVDKAYVYQRYIVPSGATPESLAYEIYGDADKYWTILFINGIVDPFTEWPMDPVVLEKWTEAKYGDVNKVIDFVNVTNSEFYDDVQRDLFFNYIEEGTLLPFNVHPVTALEHEMTKNQERGQIIVISPRFINSFIDMFNKSIEGKA